MFKIYFPGHDGNNSGWKKDYFKRVRHVVTACTGFSVVPVLSHPTFSVPSPATCLISSSSLFILSFMFSVLFFLLTPPPCLVAEVGDNVVYQQAWLCQPQASTGQLSLNTTTQQQDSALLLHPGWDSKITENHLSIFLLITFTFMSLVQQSKHSDLFKRDNTIIYCILLQYEIWLFGLLWLLT